MSFSFSLARSGEEVLSGIFCWRKSFLKMVRLGLEQKCICYINTGIIGRRKPHHPCRSIYLACQKLSVYRVWSDYLKFIRHDDCIWLVSELEMRNSLIKTWFSHSSLTELTGRVRNTLIFGFRIIFRKIYDQFLTLMIWNTSPVQDSWKTQENWNPFSLLPEFSNENWNSWKFFAKKHKPVWAPTVHLKPIQTEPDRSNILLDST